MSYGNRCAVLFALVGSALAAPTTAEGSPFTFADTFLNGVATCLDSHTNAPSSCSFGGSNASSSASFVMWSANEFSVGAGSEGVARGGLDLEGFVITGPAGQAGFLSVSASIVGTMGTADALSLGQAFLQLDLHGNNATGECYVTFQDGGSFHQKTTVLNGSSPSFGNGNCTALSPFLFNSTTLFLTAYLDVGAVQLSTAFTAALTGLRVYDAGMNDITDLITISSASGFVYPTGGPTAVPEPGTLALLGSGFGILWKYRSKRAQRAVHRGL